MLLRNFMNFQKEQQSSGLLGPLEDNLQANYEYLKNIKLRIMLFPLKNKVWSDLTIRITFYKLR